MRYLILIIGILSYSAVINAQGLESGASYIKTNYSDDYSKTIREHAINKWGNDHRMVVYEINKQSNSLIHLIDNFESENTNIVFQAIQKWSIDGYKSHNISVFKKLKTFDLESLIKLHCDWGMVKHEYDKQVKAKNSY